MSRNGRRFWQGTRIPLGYQIVALLVAGLVVAQLCTQALAILLPLKPPPKYQLPEVAHALQGGPLKVSNPRPLVRSVRTQPPSLESPNWVVSDQSREDLARSLGAPLTNVRILFYSPAALTVGGSAPRLAALQTRRPIPRLAPRVASSEFQAEQEQRPRLIKASLLTLVDMQGLGGGPGGGLPGGGFPGGGGFPSGGFPLNGPTWAPAHQPEPHQAAPPAKESQSPSSQTAPRSTPGSANAPSNTSPTGAAPSSRPADAPASGAAPPAGGQVTPNPPGAPGGSTSPNGPGEPGGSGGGPAATAPQATPIAGPHGQPDPFSPDSSTTDRSSRPSLQQPARPATDAASHNRRTEDGSRTEPAVSSSGSSDVAGAEPLADPRQPTGFVLSPADRGGYVLPSEAAPARGLFGLASTPFLQGDFVAALYEGPGHWVTVQPAPETFPTTWQRRIFIWFLLSCLIVVPIGLLFARRLAAPLVQFANAAERLGRDPSGNQAPLDGPAEIGRAARAFNQMQGRLKRYIDDRTAMVGAISHDLRTPLARMRFRLERIPPQFREGISSDIGQMDDMIGAVLTFVRDVSEPSVRERVELRSILECVVDNATLMGGEVILAPGERVPVEVDGLSVERVLTNLIDNALKYGERAHVRVFEEGPDVVAEVEDEGPGLPDEELEKVFMPFYRSDQSRNPNKPGIGLGLAVSRSIARAHGGDINLSRGRQGLKAQLRLPRAPVAA